MCLYNVCACTLQVEHKQKKWHLCLGNVCVCMSPNWQLLMQLWWHYEALSSWVYWILIVFHWNALMNNTLSSCSTIIATVMTAHPPSKLTCDCQMLSLSPSQKGNILRPIDGEIKVGLSHFYLKNVKFWSEKGQIQACLMTALNIVLLLLCADPTVYSDHKVLFGSVPVSPLIITNFSDWMSKPVQPCWIMCLWYRGPLFFCSPYQIILPLLLPDSVSMQLVSLQNVCLSWMFLDLFL